MTTVECLWDVGAELGEGPVWRNGACWFVDIKAPAVHRLDPASGEKTTWPAPEAVGFIVPTDHGGWIAGLKSGLHSFHPETGAFALLTPVEDPALDNRLNDGFVDAEGRLWFGSMHDPEVGSTGSLYRLDAAGPTVCDTGYRVTNGPAASPDGKTLYHVDTFARTIHAFDLADGGTLSNKRPLIVIEEGAGYPDGPAVDAEGCLWISLFAGWGVRRYSPTGELLRTIPFPVANVTKIAFGGTDYRDAYATTAWLRMTPAERVAQPLAGGLFRFRVDTPGLPQHEVRS